MDIFEPAVIRINETTPGERYLLRITPMNSNDEIQRCKIFSCSFFFRLENEERRISFSAL